MSDVIDNQEVEDATFEEVADNEVTIEEANDAPEFDKDKAVEESMLFLKDMLLVDPADNSEMFIATNVQMNDDGSVSIVCVKDADSEQAVMHTINSGYVTKTAPSDEVESEATEVEAEVESDLIVANTKGAGLVGADGEPLDSGPKKIIGLNGSVLN